MVLAGEIVADVGVEGLTMAALAEVSDYAPASLYTYFSSRSVLVAALQQRALLVLAQVALDSVELWDAELGTQPVPIADLALLWGFSRLLLSAPDHHPREFMLQQQLLVSPEVENAQDAASVVPTAMAVLDVPRRLLERARNDGVLAQGAPVTGPLGDPVDLDVLRTLSWVTALNGALLVDRLSTGIPVIGSTLGTQTTRGLLIGWGADPDLVDSAREFAESHLDLPDSADPVTTRGDFR